MVPRDRISFALNFTVSQFRFCEQVHRSLLLNLTEPLKAKPVVTNELGNATVTFQVHKHQIFTSQLEIGLGCYSC